jgi:hypothetical protein
LVAADAPTPERDVPAVPSRLAPLPSPGLLPVELLSPHAIAMSSGFSRWLILLACCDQLVAAFRS